MTKPAPETGGGASGREDGDGDPARQRLSTAEIGQLGERLAALFLEQRMGYKILHRNFRAPRGGEVDVVCRDGDTLAFVEVKARTSAAYGRPGEAVNREKQRLIVRGAMHWLRLLDHPEILFRFDVVEVVLRDGEPPEVVVIREAFHLPDSCRY